MEWDKIKRSVEILEERLDNSRCWRLGVIFNRNKANHRKQPETSADDRCNSGRSTMAMEDEAQIMLISPADPKGSPVKDQQAAGVGILLQIMMLVLSFVLGHVLRRHRLYFLPEASASLLIGIFISFLPFILFIQASNLFTLLNLGLTWQLTIAISFILDNVLPEIAIVFFRYYLSIFSPFL